jgi:anti-sigma B factor antagonist
MDFQHEVKNNIIHLNLSGDLIGENNGPGILDAINDHLNKGVNKAVVRMFVT